MDIFEGGAGKGDINVQGKSLSRKPARICVAGGYILSIHKQHFKK